MSPLPTWPDFTDWGRVPFNLREGIACYVTQGRPFGHFLTAVVENDLFRAMSRADDVSLAHLKDIVQFFYNQTPGACWGSPQAVSEWMARGGLTDVYGTRSHG